MKNNFLEENQNLIILQRFSCVTFKAKLKKPFIAFGLCLVLVCGVTLSPSLSNAGITGTYDGTTATGGWSVGPFGFGITLNAGSANISDNSITMTGGTLNGSIMGAYSSNATNNNTVNVQDGTVTGWVFGGWSTGAGVDNNHIIFGTVGNTTPTANSNIAGFSYGGDATGNSITINSGTITNYNIAGYTSGSGSNATGNSIIMNGGTVNGNNIVGWSRTGEASDNHLIINDGQSKYAYAGRSDSGTATNNTVNMTGGTIVDTLAAGYSSSSADVTNNAVNISGGTFSTSSTIAGGYSNSGAITDNNLSISGGTFGANSIAAAGYANGTGTVTGNNIYISGGTFDTTSIITAGYSAGSGAVTGNNIYISGGTFDTNSTLTAGYSAGSGAVTGNTMTIDTGLSSTLDLGTVKLKGGVSGGGTISDNRLVIKSRVKADSISDFEHLEFHIQEHDSDAMLEADTIDMTNVTNVEIYIGDRLEMLNDGDQINLLVGNTDITGTATNVNITAAQGFHVLYDLEYSTVITRAANHFLTVTGARAHPHSRSFIEGRLASFSFMNQGADLAIGQGIEAALIAAQDQPHNWAMFTALSGGTSRYETGGDSYGEVNFAGASMLLGISRDVAVRDSHLMVGAFLEGGMGKIDALNRFENVNDINTSGDSIYYGGGLLTRLDHRSGLYGEASFRVGNLGTDYTTDDIRFAVSHDSNSLYYGAGVGLGYQLKVPNNANIFDIYARYSWTNMEAEDVVIDSTDYLFTAINSHQLRLGARYERMINDYFSPYLGAAWEYEFDGRADGTVNTSLALSSPSIEGSSGFFEIGTKIIPKPSIPLTLSLDVEGYIGEREGLAGNLELVYGF